MTKTSHSEREPATKSILIAMVRMEADALGVSVDDMLWCVACLHSEDPGAFLRDAPDTLTLDALYRVADFFDMHLDLRLAVGAA